jgi:hypothetical protein
MSLDLPSTEHPASAALTAGISPKGGSSVAKGVAEQSASEPLTSSPQLIHEMKGSLSRARAFALGWVIHRNRMHEAVAEFEQSTRERHLCAHPHPAGGK